MEFCYLASHTNLDSIGTFVRSGTRTRLAYLPRCLGLLRAASLDKRQNVSTCFVLTELDDTPSYRVDSFSLSDQYPLATDDIMYIPLFLRIDIS